MRGGNRIMKRLILLLFIFLMPVVFAYDWSGITSIVLLGENNTLTLITESGTFTYNLNIVNNSIQFYNSTQSVNLMRTIPITSSMCNQTITQEWGSIVNESIKEACGTWINGTDLNAKFEEMRTRFEGIIMPTSLQFSEISTRLSVCENTTRLERENCMWKDDRINYTNMQLETVKDERDFASYLIIALIVVVIFILVIWIRGGFTKTKDFRQSTGPIP